MYFCFSITLKSFQDADCKEVTETNNSNIANTEPMESVNELYRRCVDKIYQWSGTKTWDIQAQGDSKSVGQEKGQSTRTTKIIVKHFQHVVRIQKHGGRQPWPNQCRQTSNRPFFGRPSPYTLGTSSSWTSGSRAWTRRDRQNSTNIRYWASPEGMGCAECIRLQEGSNSTLLSP